MPIPKSNPNRIPHMRIPSLSIRHTVGVLVALFCLPLLVLAGVQWLVPVPNVANESALIYYVATDGDDSQEGTLDHPWATLTYAAETVSAGDTVYIKGGIYALTDPIRPQQSGRRDRPITYAAAPGEHVILDAQHLSVEAPSGDPPFAHDQGAFQIEDVSHIRVRDLEITNSHNAGITVRHSDYVQLYNNTINTTFSSGIGVWNGDHHHIIGNTVLNANLPKLTDYERDPLKQTPHEAISLGGVAHFEVAYNHVYNSGKEGIDIKETSRHGTVHHNHIHDVARQGLYVDSHFGVLEDVELYDNVIHHCKGGGFMVSVEGGDLAQNIRFHHNLIYDNWGTGILMARWGLDHPRKHLEIYNNTVYHNGFGPPNPGEEFYWITGGLYLFSTQLEDVAIHHNIFAQNTGFQVGYSDFYLPDDRVSEPTNAAPQDRIQAVLNQKNIRIYDNVIAGDNDPKTPIYAGWAPDDLAYIYGINGTKENASTAEPSSFHPSRRPFINAYRDNFYLNPEQVEVDNSAANAGAFPLAPSLTIESDTLSAAIGNSSAQSPDSMDQFWWKNDFPPHVEF